MNVEYLELLLFIYLYFFLWDKMTTVATDNCHRQPWREVTQNFHLLFF